jgi:hypothetical protein
VRLVESAQVRHAFQNLKLDPAGLGDPQQIRRLGEMIGSDYLVIGNYLEHGDQFVINARVLETATGRTAPGCAGSVQGGSRELLALAQSLAGTLHDRLIDQAPATGPAADTTAQAAPEPPRPDDVVTEGELAAMIRRLAPALPGTSPNVFAVKNPAAPVTRLRTLAALVKLVVAPEVLASLPPTTLAVLPAREAPLPAWAKPLVAVAVDAGWWYAETPLRAGEPATWDFVDGIVSRLPLEESDGAPEGPLTGLIVDARGLRLQRAMGPRILDEDGNVLYPPHPRYLPSPDELQQTGMVGYCADPADDRRAGDRPLVVQAIGTGGPAREHVVISRQDAQRIRAANQRWRFLQRLAVSIHIGPRH